MNLTLSMVYSYKGNCECCGPRSTPCMIMVQRDTGDCLSPHNT